MWVETNQTFAFNNHFFNPGDAKQVGPSSDQATLNNDGGTGKGVATDGTTNAWKYTGATGLVKICAAQSSGDNNQGEWKPYVWVEESKEIEILKGNKIMFYFGMTTKWNEEWNVLRTSNTTEKTADQQYHRLPDDKCSSWISVAYVSPAQYYVGKTGWAGVQMEATAEAGCLYSVYNEDNSDKIYKNVAAGAIPHFSTTTVNKTVGTEDSEIAATVTNSIYGNKQVLYYYYTTDGGTTFTKFDPSDISSLAVGVYTVYALGWDGHILVRSDNSVTLNVGVTITLNANGGTDGDVTSVFATSGADASTGNIAAASLPTKTGYNFNGFRTSGGTEVIDENGEWIADVSGYTDDSGNWTCSAASTLYAHWTPKPYTINLEGMEADSEEPIQVNVTYDGVLSHVTPHTKTNYTFDGYWVRNESTHALETQLIDANGNWIAGVAGYTGNDGAGNPTWVHDYAISLYAKWNETPRTITLQVSPTGAGTLSPAGPVTAYIVTPSATITATPNAGWKFLRWDYGTNVGPYTGTGTDNTVQVTASVNGTLTAVFEPRYCLVGSLQDDSGDGGLPGWSDYTADFAVNSSSPVDLTRTCTLLADKTYKVQVHDKTTNTNLGRSGCNPVCVLAENASLVMENANNDVYLYTTGAGEYIFKITAIDGSGRPTVSVERPHQMHMGHKRVNIDGTDYSDNTGGTLTASISGSPVSNGDWFNYGSDITYTVAPAGGYTVTWYSNSTYSSPFVDQPANTWTNYNVTGDENIYAQFTETPTTVNLANDGHGKIQIGGEDKTETTVGVTTTRNLTAVPNDGYMFSSWTETAKTDYSTTSTSTNPTTLTGLGAGATSEQTLTANFTHRWALSTQSDGWGQEEFTIENISLKDGKTIGYVDISLAANTNYQFTMKDLLTNDIYKNNNAAVQYMTYTNHTDWGFATNYTFNCGITTAGKGTYRFTWNVTDKTMTVTYPTSYQVNYASSVGGSVTSVKDGDNNEVPNGGYVCNGGRITFTAAANTYYTFVGWCNNDTYGDTFNTELSWMNNNVTETQNSFAKFKSTNFVIYRTGDKAGDPRAAVDDVEEYTGGTISEAIEYRMKVHTLNQWTTLCLPFEVSAVKVWDPDDGPDYYDIVPYFRTGGKFYNGHYIIRTPKTATDLAIAEFDQWNDPESSIYKPVKNTPYIIQWHDPYFLGKYISFFGSTNQAIPSDFNVGEAPSADDVVNIYGNNTMQSGTVRDAYLLEPDYGPSGAWLREDIGTNRTINPFECYILANSATTTRYRILRRGATPDDTPTGWDDVCNAEPKTDIMVYTITGFPVARYYDCSFTEAAQRLHSEQGEGIYILRSANESVKLMVGGQ